MGTEKPSFVVPGLVGDRGGAPFVPLKIEAMHCKEHTTGIRLLRVGQGPRAAAPPGPDVKDTLFFSLCPTTTYIRCAGGGGTQI